MDINKKKNRKQISTFHAAEVMSRDLALLRGKKFSNYLSKVSGFVKIKISSVELILSPLYDDNEISESEVKKIYLEKFNNL